MSCECYKNDSQINIREIIKRKKNTRGYGVCFLQSDLHKYIE